MADRALRFDAFQKLSEEERCRRYTELSEHDRFKARCSQDTGVRSAPCNTCAHKRAGGKCAAFPDGITGEHLRLLLKDPTVECADGIRYERDAGTVCTRK